MILSKCLRGSTRKTRKVEEEELTLIGYVHPLSFLSHPLLQFTIQRNKLLIRRDRLQLAPVEIRLEKQGLKGKSARKCLALLPIKKENGVG